MKPQTALILRMLGPVLEIGCALTWMRTRGEGRLVLGTPIEGLLMIGFLAGLVMVVVGLTMVKRPEARRKSDLDLDLDRDRR